MAKAPKKSPTQKRKTMKEKRKVRRAQRRLNLKVARNRSGGYSSNVSA